MSFLISWHEKEEKHALDLNTKPILTNFIAMKTSCHEVQAVTFQALVQCAVQRQLDYIYIYIWVWVWVWISPRRVAAGFRRWTCKSVRDRPWRARVGFLDDVAGVVCLACQGARDCRISDLDPSRFCQTSRENLIASHLKMGNGKYGVSRNVIRSSDNP